MAFSFFFSLLSFFLVIFLYFLFKLFSSLFKSKMLVAHHRLATVICIFCSLVWYNTLKEEIVEEKKKAVLFLFCLLSLLFSVPIHTFFLSFSLIFIGFIVFVSHGRLFSAASFAFPANFDFFSGKWRFSVNSRLAFCTAIAAAAAALIVAGTF